MSQGGRRLAHDRIRLSRSIIEEAIETGEAVISREIPTHAPASSLSPGANPEESSFKSALIVPLRHQGEMLGVLYLDSHVITRNFGPLDIQLLALFARHAAISLANARAYHEIETLRGKLESENVYLQQEIESTAAFTDLVAESPRMRRALSDMERVANTDSTVLIRGETGTGKEVLARAIHAASPRRAKPMIKVNIAALPDTLVEAELFGHEKGAFTGADSRRIGRFELAEGGTLFLDEIGDLPPSIQVKLLRVLQEREFERLGSTRTQSTNVRVITATNRDLESMIREGTFREDLFYRLNVFPIDLPPLRDRGADILKIAAQIIGKRSREMGRDVRGIDDRTRQALLSYRWPGNIRELSNVLERAVILSRGPVITSDCLSLDLDLKDTTDLPMTRGGIPLNQMLKDLKIQCIREALRKTGGNQAQAASLLGLHRSNLNRLIRDLQIAPT